MMKFFVKALVTVVLGLAIVATPASAQIKWQLGLGPTLPMGDFGDSFKLGFHAMGGANFALTEKPISFRADVAYNINKCDIAGCGNISSNLLTLSGNVQYNFPTPSSHPYLTGGLTWGRASLGGSDAPSGIDAESDIGFNVGGGLHFDLGGTTAFLEARYFSIGGNLDADFIPITFCVRF